jgi:predicted acyl esterase
MMMQSVLTRISVIFALAAGATPGWAQAPGRGQEMTAEMKARLEKAPKFVEMSMPMRDTVVLAANVYLPAGTGPFPTVLLRTPYIKDNPREPLAAQKYVEAGYAYVDQDTRGKGHSKGVYRAFSTDIEDGYDTVEWIAKQPWSNGKIGIMGTSALGITANMAAMSGAPHLLAAYVSLAPYEQLRNTYPGGVLKDADTIGWTRRQGADEAILAGISGNALDSQNYAKNSVLTNQLGATLKNEPVGTTPAGTTSSMMATATSNICSITELKARVATRNSPSPPRATAACKVTLNIPSKAVFVDPTTKCAGGITG